MTPPAPFDAGRWRRLNALLDELLELAPADQDSRLAALADRDPHLAADARSFLADAAATETFLAHPAAETAARLVEEVTRNDAPEARLGQRLGAWELAGILGEGGMGVVYAARRCDGQYEAEAAVKLMLAVDPASPLRPRLLAERQMLARLDDPRIARLLDGGLSEDGHPYLVMERVDGLTLLDHCEEKGLGLLERLHLFGEVCAAVYAAHQRMILHCDLKPSNILVTPQGELKLLDFGVARSLAPTDEPLPAPGAAAGPQLLTPDYASPEQLSGLPLTASSDVYSLGVVLHELLTGAKPGPPAAEPTPPPRPWAKRLRGDLGNILAKALAADPASRYPSPHDLADDLNRWRLRRTVSATPTSTAYRLRRRLDRNRLATAAALAIGLALVLGLSTTAWQARIAQQQRDQARRESLRAQTVSTFLTDLFTVSDPNENAGADLTAREILERGRAQIDLLDGEPETRAALLEVLGLVHFRLGQMEQSRQLYAAELEAQQSLYGDQSDEVSDTRIDLAVCLLELGLLDEASEQIAQTLAYRQPRPRPDQRWLSVPLSVEARIASQRRDYVTAARLYRELLGSLDPEAPDLQETLARAWNNNGVALAGLGRMAAADSAYAQALIHYQRSVPEPHSYYGNLYSNWALVAQTRGDPQRAEEYHRQSLAIRRQLKHNRVDIGVSLINLGNLLVETGRPGEALPLLQEALAIQQEAFGPAHLYVGAAEINLGLAHLALGDVRAADDRFRRGEEVLRQVYGDDNPAVAVALVRRGQAARAAGDLNRAADLLDQAIVMHRRHLPNYRHRFGEALLELAEVQQQRGLTRAGADLAAEAAEVFTETVGADHDLTLRAHSLAGLVP